MPSRIRILAGKSARFLYRRLPLPLPVRWRIKSFFYRHLGLFLKNSTNYQQWLIQTGTLRPALVKTLDSATLQSSPILEIGPKNLASSRNSPDPATDPVRLIAFYPVSYTHLRLFSAP